MIFTRWIASRISQNQKLDCQMPNNSQLEERLHGVSTSYVVLVKEQGNTKIIPLCRKFVGRKIVIRTELCMTKHITYMHTYKTGLH